MSPTSHQAAHTAIGYLYQSQWPLFELIRRAPAVPDAALSLELQDDVVFDASGVPAELLQVKHHLYAQGGLGDKDVDLWKTIGVWMDAHPAGDPGGPLLGLVSTGVAAEGTAAGSLRPGPERDGNAQKLARQLLDNAARDSVNASTAPLRQRYLNLREADRDVFVSRIFVLDGAPQAGVSLDDEVRKALHWALVTAAGHENSFMEQLWGWWHGVAVELLRRERSTVSAIDVAQKVDEIADSYRPDNLPVLVFRDDVAYDVEQTVGDPTYVQQIKWIAHTSRMLQQAMVDYYRAYSQRAKWIDRDLIGVGELDTFEENLRDEWERAFESMIAKLGAGADDAAKEQAGHDLFRELSNQTIVKVRERFDDPFFMRGTLHAFADQGHVGWHPHFEDKLKELLGQ